MHRFILTSITSLMFLCAGVARADVPDYVGQRISTPEDIAAITKVTEDFRTALNNKNTRQMSSFLLNSNILFSSAPSPQKIKEINEKYDANFDGVFSGGFRHFADYLTKPGIVAEQKFYNMKITQDDHMAWVMFDFEFFENKKIENYGVETWQLIKAADDKWKIVSILWSSHGVPKQ
jgi:hypothetical protein